MKAEICNKIFNESIEQYHKTDDVNTSLQNPYEEGTFEYLLYLKNWIDTVQWHLEDIIRMPELDLQYAISIKRRIDKSNQHRTDVVERIDDWFLGCLNSSPKEGAKLNTESPAWVIDRMSILCLKIYHMQEQVERDDVSDEHKTACQNKLNILLEQQKDLSQSYNELIDDIQSGEKYMKVYRQMKMYNDKNLNPALYKKSNT